MKKIWIIGAAISLTLILGACSKQTQTTPSTTAVETTDRELADQASKEVEVMESLEANSQVVYDEESGDIINAEDDETFSNIMEILRQDVQSGKLTEGEIDDTVPILCYFLDEGKQKEFIRELHSLVPVENEVVQETQPAKQPKESQPAQQPTKSVPKETQPQATEPVTQPQVTQPEVQPTQPQQSETQYEAGTTMKDANGNEVHKGKLSDSQTLSPEEEKAINEIQFN